MATNARQAATPRFPKAAFYDPPEQVVQLRLLCWQIDRTSCCANETMCLRHEVRSQAETLDEQGDPSATFWTVHNVTSRRRRRTRGFTAISLAKRAAARPDVAASQQPFDSYEATSEESGFKPSCSHDRPLAVMMMHPDPCCFAYSLRTPEKIPGMVENCEKHTVPCQPGSSNRDRCTASAAAYSLSAIVRNGPIACSGAFRIRNKEPLTAAVASASNAALGASVASSGGESRSTPSRRVTTSSYRSVCFSNSGRASV